MAHQHVENSVFISYHHDDEPQALKLQSLLKREHINACLVPKQLDIGDEWTNEIVERINASYACVVLITAKSAASVQVAHEWSIAIALKKRIVPVLMESVAAVKIPPQLRTLQRADLCDLQDTRGVHSIVQAIHKCGYGVWSQGEGDLKYVGEAPGCLHYLLYFLEGSKRLDILTDFAAYGHFTLREWHERYQNVLSNRRTTLAFHAGAHAEVARKSIFTKEDFYANQQSGEISRYFTYYGHPYGGNAASKITYDEYIAAVSEIDKQLSEKLRRNGVRLQPRDKPIQIFAWLADEKEAMFSVQSNVNRDREVVFWTKQDGLVRALKDMFDDFCQLRASDTRSKSYKSKHMNLAEEMRNDPDKRKGAR